MIINQLDSIRMAEKGGQPGNKNATKNKPWREAINRALKKREESRVDGKKALDELAEAFLKKCDEGDIQALKELGDRIEGKPAQTVDMNLKDITHEEALDALENGSSESDN